MVAEPETKILQLTPDMEFLVLASDGLWGEVRTEPFMHEISILLFGSIVKSGNAVINAFAAISLLVLTCISA